MRKLMVLSFKFDLINWDSPLYISNGVGYNFEKNDIVFYLEDFFTRTNSVYHDEMQYYAAFHLGLHCLKK